MSKRIIEHPAPKAGDLVGPQYWRSLDDKTGTPEFKDWLNREFPAGSDQAGFNRRHFLKMMGASFGLAGLGLAGCREPKNLTLPYAKQPENLIPGVAQFFASSFPGLSSHQPIIVETHQHRPTKIEGNTSYAPNGYASSKFAQASILDLYDPDRAAGSQNKAGRVLSDAEVTDALRGLAKSAKASNGAGLVFLAQPTSSPSRARLVAALRKQLPEAVWAEYAPVSTDGGDRALSKLAGRALRARPDFAAAKRVVSFDADFLGGGDDELAVSRAFAKARRVDDSDKSQEEVAKLVEGMVRLYSVESTFSLTGAQADHRLRLSASQIPTFVALFVAEVLEQTGGHSDLAASLATKASGLSVDKAWIKESVTDLVAHKGVSLLVAGDHLPEAVHALVALANAALGAEGKTLSYVSTNDTAAAGIADVVAAIASGKASTLVILGGNPAYDAPADLTFEKTVRAAKSLRVVRHGYYSPAYDETSALAQESSDGLFLAASHYLESWGDGRAADGTYVPVQPMIAPLYPSVGELDILAAFAGESGDAYAVVKTTFASLGGSNFEAWLAEGVLAGSGYKAVGFSPTAASVTKLVDAANFSAPALAVAANSPVQKNLELRISPSSHAHDGRYANNGWLAENPDAMLKTNWENVIVISPKLADALHVDPAAMFINKVSQLNRNINQFNDGALTARVAKLSLDGGKTFVKGPLFILPGQPDATVGVQLGFGRRKVGRIGTRVSEKDRTAYGAGTGFDVYPLVNSKAPAFATGLTLELTDEKVVVASTQDHWSMEGRDIIREANLEDFKHQNDFAQHMGTESHSPKMHGVDAGMDAQKKSVVQPRGNSAYDHIDHSKPLPNVAVWQGHESEFPVPQQWGMAIDLNTCTGCNACVVACQAENNIPIVGRDQTLKGRDMRWIRLDRYFFDGRNPSKDGTLAIPEDPQVSFMSVACMHCETAPCESVCPANATVHDAEGLNTMAYNRCIGTRYCANNCPYKVRRFNFLDYSDRKIGHFYEGPMGPGGLMGGKETPELTKMQKNPNVTVRMRGVMEKCTFCVQRIQEAKISQKRTAGASGDVKVPDRTIKVACEQACAAEAIVFGDVSDAKSEVSRLKRSKRDYSVLGYLNTRPRTTYLAKLRNPNKLMPGYKGSPLSRLEYDAKNPAPHAEHGAHEAHAEHGAHEAHAEHGAHEAPAHAPAHH